MSDQISQQVLKKGLDRIIALAFEVEPPNTVTPQIAQICQELSRAACIPLSSDVPAVPEEAMIAEGVISLRRGLEMFGGNYTQIVSDIWEDMHAVYTGEGKVDD